MAFSNICAFPHTREYKKRLLQAVSHKIDPIHIQLDKGTGKHLEYTGTKDNQSEAVL
jgi:hypothetical protein